MKKARLFFSSNFFTDTVAVVLFIGTAEYVQTLLKFWGLNGEPLLFTVFYSESFYDRLFLGVILWEFIS